MKKLFYSILAVFAILSSFGQASQFTNDNNDGRPRDPQSDQMNFVPNEVLVKFKDEVTINNGTQLKSAGINNIDQVLKNYGSTTLEKLFPSETKLKSVKIVKDPTGKDMVIPNLSNIYKIVLPQLKSTTSQPVDIFQFIEEMKALPEVEYAEPNYIYSIGDFTPAGPEMSMLEAMEQPKNDELSSIATGLVPNDPLYNQQWGIPATNIDDVWNTTTGDSTQIIAILDTGVDWLHPDLAANIWKNPGEIPNNGKDDDGNGLKDDIRGWDYINNDNNPTDDNSHGTHVAGIAAAVGNNGIGISGVNWRAKIMPLKVIQSSGKGDAATIAKGVTYAASKGATVINMSFGSYAESLTLKNTLASAYANAVLIAAAGNDEIAIGPCFGCAPIYPGAYSFVLGIEANNNSSRAKFSNYDQDGPVFSLYVDLLNYELKAPGVGILSCIPGGNYREYNGTSMAAPLVAGAVSLYRKQKPTESQEIMFGNLINSLGQHIDLEKALNIIPVPKLDIISYSITDTIDGDRDGRPDIGETIEIKVKVRNTWGKANDVKVGIEFNEFEDHSIATILSSEASVGSVSSYASKENIISLKIKLSTNINDGRDIVFKLKTWYSEHLGEKSQPITINVENGIELKGVINKNMTLYANKQYIITDNLAIFSGVTLTIKPGTILKLKKNVIISNSGRIKALGKPDSLIVFTKSDLNSNWNEIMFGNEDSLKYCVFEYFDNFNSIYNIRSKTTVFEDCIFRYGLIIGILHGNNYARCSFYYNKIYNHEETVHGLSNKINIINNTAWVDGPEGTPINFGGLFAFIKNSNIFNNTPYSIYLGSPQIAQYKTNLYLGSANEDIIRKSIFDFYTYNSGAFEIVDLTNKATRPYAETHGIIWKVVVNGKDAQDEFDHLDPLGVGKQKFEIYFNRPMDIKYPPSVSMGVRYPYSQTSIGEDGSWNADSSIYTVYGTIGLTSGDGINTIRLIGAKDMDHFEIPIEDRRFKVIVNSAGSASANFMATSGLGKVSLEWNNTNLEDGLGYNMYRMEQVNDSTLTVPKLINSTLIADTLYTDFAVTPNKKYFYYYKILRTNLSETDSSKIVAATPFTASKGDANGDLKVNVLDVTTIMAYLLNNNPQPFILEAADVNSDKSINVLDVVATIYIILNGGQKAVELNESYELILYLKNDTLFADTPVAIGGIQFDISGVNSVEEIEKLEALNGFESGYSQNTNTLRMIFYSLSGKTIQAGNHIPLLKLGKGCGITEIVFADNTGHSIIVNYSSETNNSTGVWNLHENMINGVAELGQNYPNPYTGQTTIPVKIFEPVDEVIIRIINNQGQNIGILQLKNPVLGENLLEWNSGQHKGLMGYMLEISRNDKHAVCGMKKMLVH